MRAGHHCAQPLHTKLNMPATARASFYVYSIPRGDRPAGRFAQESAENFRGVSMDIYREIILDHYQHPHHHGRLDDADASYDDSNPLCGDQITMYLKVGADGRDQRCRL